MRRHSRMARGTTNPQDQEHPRGRDLSLKLEERCIYGICETNSSLQFVR